MKVGTPLYYHTIRKQRAIAGKGTSLKKREAVIRNASLPPKPGSLPRGRPPKHLAAQYRAIVEAREAERQKKFRDPIAHCERNCGYKFRVVRAMCTQLDMGNNIVYTCPRCDATNMLTPKKTLKPNPYLTRRQSGSPPAGA